MLYEVITAVLEDPSERVWLRTSEGLFEVDSSRATVSKVTTADGLADDAVTTIRLGEDGRLWAGTVNGLSVWSGVWTTYRGFGLSSQTVNGLLQDHQGRLRNNFV